MAIDENKAAGHPGIPALHGFWSRRLRAMRGERCAENTARQRYLDRVLTDTLGIGQEQAARFLAAAPTFEAFVRFVLDCNGGAVAPGRVARVNALQDGTAHPADVRQWHAAVRASPPVLDATDLAHWHEHGYVVLKQAITTQECAVASATVHAHVGADAQDPQTWHAAYRRQGIMVQLFQHPALDVARTSLRIQKAFAQLWNDEDLVMTTDRCGFNPPEGRQFTFPGPHLHWDADLKPPMPLGIQGILYLADTPAEQGAFSCIPGFHRGIDDWLRSLPAGVDPYSRIPAGDARPIAGQAGDLIAWHHALPHGSSPNRGVRPRVVQYLTMYPARMPA